jgi:hypothetical protein
LDCARGDVNKDRPIKNLAGSSLAAYSQVSQHRAK